MDAIEGLIDHGPATQGEHCDPASAQGDRGTSTGATIKPGTNDDGWIVSQPVRIADDTVIQLFKDGEALHAAYEAIQHARHLICLEVYIFANDDTGRAFAKLLSDKARKGVRVHVIYDSFGSRGIMGTLPMMFSEMREAGVRLQEFHPTRPWEAKFGWRPVNRNHRKLLIIDHHIAGLGGINVGAEYGGSWTARTSVDCDLWRDNAIGIQGPAVRLLLRAFARTWQYCLHGGRISRAEFYHPLDESGFGVLCAVPTINSPLLPILHRLFRTARESIELTMAYFAPDDGLIDELCRAARRGVRVRLMLPGRCDVGVLVVAARSFYEKLMNAGVEIYERQAVILHAKTMVIDSAITVIGSTNLDYRSIEYNLELSAAIRSKEFGRQMNTLFDYDVRFAKRILLSEWRKRPWWDRTVQWAVSRTRYVL